MVIFQFVMLSYSLPGRVSRVVPPYSVIQMRTMVLEYESQHLPEQNHPDLQVNISYMEHIGSSIWVYLSIAYLSGYALKDILSESIFLFSPVQTRFLNSFWHAPTAGMC